MLPFPHFCFFFLFFSVSISLKVHFIVLLTKGQADHLNFLILGDPGAVSRAGRKGAINVFKHWRKSPWVPTLTGPFPNGQANTGSWLGTKRLCIIVPNPRTASPEFFCDFVHDGYWLDHGLSGSCTKEMHTFRKLLFWYKLSISKYCLPKN